jgi:hypothetical protein
MPFDDKNNDDVDDTSWSSTETLKFKWSAWKSNAKIEGYYVYIGTFPGGEMLRTQISIRIGSLHG